MVIFGLFVSQATASRPILTDAIFTADSLILTQANFWFDIYYHVPQDEGLLHHPDALDVVYARIQAGEQNSPASRETVRRETSRLEAQLRVLAEKDMLSLTSEERKLRARLPAEWDSSAIADAAGRIRFQRGIKERFQAGIERSYRYLDMIDSTFGPMGLPSRLKYLPHVESSFLPHAYSKVGAAGMWQFMKSSGKAYLTIGYHVDERRDPYRSTEAAGKLLKYNFGRLQSWPLALVAYNHGAGGMSRAVRMTGTRDLGTIIANYRSRTFGFASKNFYAEFLAASSIAMQADSLYPNLEKWAPLSFHEMVLTRNSSPEEISRLTGLSMVELEEYNLALRPATFRKKGSIPKGYALRLPVEVALAELSEGLLGAAMARADEVAAPQAKKTARDHVESAPDKSEAVALAQAEKKALARKTSLRAEVPVLKESGPVLTSGESVSPAAPVELASSQALMPPQKVSTGAPSSPWEPARKESGVDEDFVLLSADVEKLAHPSDRFDPAVYHLDHTYQNGMLTIRVGGEETLSHYVEWSGIPSRVLRSVNQIVSSGDFRVNRFFRLPIKDSARVEEFLSRREENHRAMEEDFYGNYHVSSTKPMVIVRGFNLWMWAYEQQLPFWLLQKHNPGKNLQQLGAGEIVRVPIVETGIRRWGFTRYAGTREFHRAIGAWISDPTL